MSQGKGLWIKRWLCHSTKIVIFFALPMFILTVYAHGEKIDVGAGRQGPVTLTQQQQEAIGLQLTTVTKHTIDDTLTLNGEMELLPNQQADVSLRISGQVKAIFVNLGDVVTQGQPLTVVQSRLVGNPPPSVQITAPMAGVIDARNINVGQSVEPNTVLFHISDRTQMVLVAKLYEEDLGKVKINQKARVHMMSYPQQPFLGNVYLVSPQLDPLTRTVDVWIKVININNLLKPNMFGRANVILQRKEGALVIPNQAIIQAEGEDFVFVKKGNQFNRVDVKTGIKNDQYTEIVGGLAAGDEVVLQGNRELYTAWLVGSKAEAKDEH